MVLNLLRKKAFIEDETAFTPEDFAVVFYLVETLPNQNYVSYSLYELVYLYIAFLACDRCVKIHTKIYSVNRPYLFSTQSFSVFVHPLLSIHI